jgi:Tfp pilus assembly protein FimT
MKWKCLSSPAGFSLVDLMMTVAVMSTVFAIALPAAKDAVDGLRLGMATRDIERELQTARMRAVSANRPMRVRLNCPGAGQFRIVEVTGVAGTDTAANRCDETVYPYPGPKDTNQATPAHDGAVKRFHFTVSLSGAEVQFNSNGTAQQVISGTPQAIATTVSATITKSAASRTVTVNGLGKIQIN